MIVPKLPPDVKVSTSTVRVPVLCGAPFEDEEAALVGIPPDMMPPVPPFVANELTIVLAEVTGPPVLMTTAAVCDGRRVLPLPPLIVLGTGDTVVKKTVENDESGPEPPPPDPPLAPPPLEEFVTDVATELITVVVAVMKVPLW